MYWLIAEALDCLIVLQEAFFIIFIIIIICTGLIYVFPIP